MAKKGRAIYLVYTDLVDDRHDEEFNTWYNTRHLPQLTAIPGILDAARYVAVKGGPKYLAAYELENAEVIRSRRVRRTGRGQRGTSRCRRR